MCWLGKLFSNALVLAYPEEPPDYTKTLDNTDIDTALTDWMINYFVPTEYWWWWGGAIVISLTNNISYPAATYDGADGKRHLDVRPEYLNAGVIAHEQAHNSYSLMTDTQKVSFNSIYTPLKYSDPLIKLLYSKNTYGLTSDIEGHAEIYRYLGGKIPSALKTFYPKLF